MKTAGQPQKHGDTEKEQTRGRCSIRVCWISPDIQRLLAILFPQAVCCLPLSLSEAGYVQHEADSFNDTTNTLRRGIGEDRIRST